MVKRCETTASIPSMEFVEDNAFSVFGNERLV